MGVLSLSGVGNAGFSPSTIPGLKYWFESWDPRTMITTSGGATLCASDGDRCGRWLEKSGNGFDLQQPTDANRVTYKTGGPNGVPYLRGASAGALYLQVASGLLALAQPSTIFAVYRKYSGGAYVYDSALGSARNALLDNAGAEDMFAGAELTGGTTNSNWRISTAQFYGIASKLRIDGVQVASGDAGTASMDGITIGHNSGSGNDVDVAALLVYNAALTAPQIAQIERYLNSHTRIF